MIRFFAMWFALFLVVGLGAGTSAGAQQQVFIQIEAQPNLAQARRSLQGYADRFGNLNGFALSTGWFGIALGPYPEEEAASLLRSLRAAQLIPRDSFIAREGDFRGQFWPDGATQLRQATVPEAAQDLVTESDEAEDTQPRETLRQARAGEADLSREDRAELQKALAWAGFYAGEIDAAFGPGTRSAMSRWQEAQALPATGVLTTRQRASLLGAYNAPLDGLTLTRVEDAATGIALTLPTGAVSFARYEAPFAHFEATGDLQARVLLISQSGNRASLAGLYDVLQNLDIMPLTGPRDLRAEGFTITGQDSQRSTHIEAILDDGVIKGFALIWPPDDEARRARVLRVMQDSFTRLDGVLDPNAGLEAGNRIDLLAGLDLRQPLRTRSGFFVDARGWVVTTADAVAGCTRITLDDATDAEMARVDTETGLALLQPTAALAPRRVASFTSAPPLLRSDVVAAGYSYGGLLTAPSVTFGTLADLSGLNGEPDVTRLALSVRESDAGGPVLNDSGAVLGLLLPRPTGQRILPEDVHFAASPEVISRLLNQAGITPDTVASGPTLSPETLRQRAAGMTVLVSCWE